jgi:diacylglycerol kinase family enzyme
VRRLRVESRARLDVALDGEIHGRLPGDFEVAARAVRVVTPVDFDDGRD